MCAILSHTYDPSGSCGHWQLSLALGCVAVETYRSQHTHRILKQVCPVHPLVEPDIGEEDHHTRGRDPQRCDYGDEEGGEDRARSQERDHHAKVGHTECEKEEN